MKKIVMIFVIWNCLFFLFSCSNETQNQNVQKDSKETKVISGNKENIAKKATGTGVDIADHGTFVFLRTADENYEFYDIDEKKIYEGTLKENCDISCWHTYKQHLYIMVHDRKNKSTRLKDINLETKEEHWLNAPNSVFYIYKDNIYFQDEKEDTGVVEKTNLECNAVKTVNLNSNKEGVSLELIYNDKMYSASQNKIYTCDLAGEQKQCVMKGQGIKEIFFSTFDVIDDRLYFLAENKDTKTCVYCISLASFELKKVCQDVSCYVLGEKGIYYVSEDDGNVCYKTYENPENTEKIAMENGSNSILKYGGNGWLIQEQNSISDGQIYAFNELKGESKILFQVSNVEKMQKKGRLMKKDENISDIEIIEYYDIQEDELYQNRNITPTSAYAVIEVQEKFLIGYNSYREQWEFPAGKIESGETAMEAARRELYEETHQIVDELEFCGLFKIYDKTKKEYRFRAVYKGEAESLTEFVPWENDEMLGIRLWDFGDESIYVDPVDTKMVEMLMRKNHL